MKTLYFILISVMVGFNASAQSAEKVKWYTIEEAQKLNAKSPRKIMVDVYTDWCGWCKKMDAEPFNHPVIAKYINENFYPVKFDAESSAPVEFGGHTFTNESTGARSTHQFAAALLNGKMSYPSVAYLTGKLEMIGAVPGFYTPAQIEPLLHYIVEEKYKDNVSLEDYQKTFVSSLAKK